MSGKVRRPVSRLFLRLMAFLNLAAKSGDCTIYIVYHISLMSIISGYKGSLIYGTYVLCFVILCDLCCFYLLLFVYCKVSLSVKKGGHK